MAQGKIAKIADIWRQKGGQNVVPRLKKSEEQQANAVLLAAIARQQTYLGYTDDNVAAMIGVSMDTYRRRKRDPDGFRLRELRALRRKLQLSDRDLSACCGATYRGTTPWEGLP